MNIKEDDQTTNERSEAKKACAIGRGELRGPDINNVNVGSLPSMRVALLDLNHHTVGIHTNTVPLGSGLIAAYARKKLPAEIPVDFKIFKNPNDLLLTIKTWLPDVVGLAQYSWNSELNYFCASRIKKINPKLLVVAGGPNLELADSRRLAHLRRLKNVDLAVEFDGEIPFAEIIIRVAKGESVEQIRSDPPAGVYSLSFDGERLSHGKGMPPRLADLNDCGSVYAEGIFDEFLDSGWHPFVQTHRGCPFACTYCHTSHRYYNKMIFQDTEVFRKDIEYLAKRFAGQHHIVLYIANTNMGLFKEDFDIARVIREVQDKYDWPKYIDCNSGKDPVKLQKLTQILKGFVPAIAFQSLTEQVLKNINRKNTEFSAFQDFQLQALRTSAEHSGTEIILSLPGETRETFLAGLRTLINSGLQDICIYTLMSLKGTPLGSDEHRSRYAHDIRYRVVPRQFSKLYGETVIDTEEVVVGTSTMPFSDYLDLRGVSFLVSAIFSAPELKPLKQFMMDYRIDLADWIFTLHGRIPENRELKTIYGEFIRETEEELFETHEALMEFYRVDRNWDSLVAGINGDNIARKYKCLMVSTAFPMMLKASVECVRELVNDFTDRGNLNGMLDELERFLSFRNLEPIIRNGYGQVAVNMHSFQYDLLSWIESVDPERRLDYYKQPCVLELKAPDGGEQKLRDLLSMNRDASLSLQILVRDNRTRDLWPIWARAVCSQPESGDCPRRSEGAKGNM
ncbi:MAG: radical SAM protein [Verrucomicrobiae bacterium]